MKLPTGTWLCEPCERVVTGPCPQCGAKPRKRAKYNNRKVTIDGHTFDSKKEGERYLVLKAEQEAGRIADLVCQPRFPCVVNGVEVCVYVADFMYYCYWGRIVEDVKSEITRKHPVYRLKVKLVRAIHGVEIVEVT